MNCLDHLAIHAFSETARQWARDLDMMVVMQTKVSNTQAFQRQCHTVIDDYMFSSSTTWDRTTTHPKFDPTGVRTHDLQIMTVHFMSLRRLGRQ